MKKSILYSAILFAGVKNAAAQIPNADFENWEKIETQQSKPLGWTAWSTITNFLSSSPAPIGITETRDSHTGKSAIKVTVDEYTALSSGIKDTSVGIAFTAKIEYVGQGVSEFGFPLNGKPAELVGFYKLTLSKKDTAAIAIEFSKWNTRTKEKDYLGRAIITFANSTNIYTKFTIPIIYDKFGAIPDSAEIFIISSITKKPIPGTTLYIDNLALAGGTNSVSGGLSALQNEVYPNPAHTLLNISNVDQAVTSICIKDMTGKILDEQATDRMDIIKYNTENYSNGMYFFELKDASQKLLQRGKFTVSK